MAVDKKKKKETKISKEENKEAVKRSPANILVPALFFIISVFLTNQFLKVNPGFE